MATTGAERGVVLVGAPDWTAAVREVLSAADAAVAVHEASAPALRDALADGDAVDALDGDGPRCLVCDDSTSADRGLSFLETVREGRPDLPVAFVPREGDEALAGAAVEAGATAYVPFDEREAALVDRIERATDAGERAARARRFDALVDDPDTFLWTLDRDGRVAEATDGDGDATAARFDALDRWSESARGTIRAAVERARDGKRVDRTVETADGETTLSLSFRPIEGDRPAGVLVYGRDVTERERLERELRRSEELHRVTLAHMTDTVLLTNDDGEFTYVCPNVHFIFGYTAEEIHEMGTIDALLGEDLYDEAELDAEGVLTNVECTAEDRDGDEHALLVNVRRVSIQDGTTLFSCRDVTRRKQRERALTSLHDTTRELLYAESKPEIAGRVVDDAAAVLDLPAAAVYLFDAEESVLEPAAYAGSLVADGGRPRPRWPGDGSVISTAFVGNDARTFENLGRWGETDLRLRSAVVVPLGDHGVFVVGSGDPDAIDDVTREVADLLAATAEAAMDRVERESALRERDRELERQNRRLTDLNRVNEIIRGIGQDVVDADTREGIEAAVCERLTEADRFAFAWIGDVDVRDGAVRPRAWAGDERGYLDVLGAGTEGTDPGERTLESGEPTVVENVATGLRKAPWRSAALTRGFQSVASVPLAYDEFGYGALTVYAERADAFDETTRSVLRELGETIAAGIGSVERTDALLGGRSVELAYELDGTSTVFGRLARRADCEVELEGGLQRVSDGVLAFATVAGAPAERVVALANESASIADARVVSEGEDGGLIRLHLSRPFLATRLVEHGAVVGTLAADPGGTTMAIDVPSSVETRSVDDLVRTTCPDATLVARRERDGPPATRERLAADVLAALTDRQLEVVRTAYHAGFFRTPRERTGSEVADSLDISPTAFSNHLRAVQRKLFAALFDDAAGG
ncbi:bacterio-opsin activator domain-containing protein [Salinilacihabitans rarus]|uniref:bacterio-opsin activator domain-containing protein n=1 Tax=Salinilacihabitans rarus TaxID=2961596 RepID=UPI0020C88D77|nr:bacterio-opsin activator domain-containing protein [Salinilacihabitans rarus]